MSNVTTLDPKGVKVRLIESNFITRWACHVCGGRTEKVAILAEVTGGPHEGFRVCESCIREGGIDAKLRERAERLRTEADSLPALVGRLNVPTLRDYQLAELRYDAKELPGYIADMGGDVGIGMADAAARAIAANQYTAASEDDILQAYGVSQFEAEKARRRALEPAPKTFDVPADTADALPF